MTRTLDDVKSKKSEPSTEEKAARELVRLAKERGLSLTGPMNSPNPTLRGADAGVRDHGRLTLTQPIGWALRRIRQMLSLWAALTMRLQARQRVSLHVRARVQLAR